MAMNEKQLLSPVNIQHVFSSHLSQTHDCTLYNDTKLICKDRTIFSSRLLLSLAFPFLETPLACLEKMIEPVIILPDFVADELVRNIHIFLSETEVKDCEKKDEDMKFETEEEIIVYPKVEFEEHKDDTEVMNDTEDLDDTEDHDDTEDLYLDGTQVCLNTKCMEYFATMEERDFHMETCKASFSCKFCKETFSTNAEKNTHEQSYIDSSGKFMCEEQLQKSCQIFLYKCTFCRETFATEEEQGKHEERYMTVEGQLMCGFVDCNGILKSRKCLVQHIKAMHYEKKVKTYTCYFCAETFVGKENHLKHLERYQDGPEDYKCPEKGCGKNFKTARGRTHLLAHIRTHLGKLDFNCEVCGKLFSAKFQKTSHMKTHESVEIPCNICSKVFKKIPTFKLHMEISHGDEEGKVKYKCDQCERGFAKKARLRDHMLSHSDVRNFICKTCGKKFKTTLYLRRHERIHTGVKPFKCSHCGKGFITPEKMRKHELIHTGVMDFCCSNCGKRFNQKVNMNTHEKKCIGSR